MSPRVIVHLVCLFRLDLVQARVLCSVLDVINAFLNICGSVMMMMVLVMLGEVPV